MAPYLVRKAALLLLVLWGVSTLVFFLMHLIPGDPVEIMLGETAMASDKEELRRALGLDRPVIEQYGRFLGGLVRGDLGRSINLYRDRPVFALVMAKFPATLELSLAALAVALLVAIPAGAIAAVRQYSLFDHVGMVVSLLGVSMPNFWLGPLLIIAFALPPLDLFPDHGRGTALHLVLPAVTLGTSLAAVLARMVRASLLEVLPQDYLTVARAKGLSEWTVIAKHGLRNAFIPVLTLVGLQCGALLSGSIITETIFAWPGMGQLTLKAITARDYPLVQGCVLTIAFTYVLINTATDLAYAAVDPRVRLRGD